MKFEVLKRSHLKRNINIGLFAVAIISATVLNFTQAKYRVTESIPLINGTIHYIPYDLNLVAIYQESATGEYVEIDTVPTSGYTLNESESYCEINDTKDNTITIEYQDGKVNFLGLTKKGTKCYLYFDEEACGEACQTILAGKDIQERTSFNSALTTNTNGIIYQEETSDGTTYYFAGNTTENWVSFAGYYWRIIRINEDGSIRMIYNGTTTNQTGTNTQYTTSNFNPSGNDNMYMGYMYTPNEVHGTQNDSNMKKLLDEWYVNNISGTNDELLISREAGFCGDRTSTTTDGGAPNDTGGTGTTKTYYGARYRLITNKIPTLECPDKDNDLYTVDESSKGNHALTYPIGLITADEVSFAGGVYGSINEQFYLYSYETYWTMSPFITGNHQFYVYESGSINAGWAREFNGVRPVINLDAGVQLSGSGTTTDPYTVS